jgi:hypothetical protein
LVDESTLRRQTFRKWALWVGLILDFALNNFSLS